MKKILFIILSVIILTGCAKQTTEVHPADEYCIRELTVITGMILLYAQSVNAVIESYSYGTVTLNEVNLTLINAFNKIANTKAGISEKDLDKNCSAEIQNEIIIPLMSAVDNYVLGYEKITTNISDMNTLLSADEYLSLGDNGMHKVEEYLLLHMD